MKKILLLSIIALLLNGCRYINTKNHYLDAKESKPLEIPAGLDSPNSTSELDVPNANSKNSLDVSAKSPPPVMPIRTKESKKGDSRIENKEGYAVLTVRTEKTYMWEALKELSIENWTITNTNIDNCVVDLKYNDIAARERENKGFIKKLFTRDSLFSDYSGQYKLSCEEKGSLVTVKFSKYDDSKPNSFLADSVMNALFEKFQ